MIFPGFAKASAVASSLVIAAASPLAAQEQKGTLIFAVESLAAQTLDPILEGRPGNAVYQAAMYDSLVGFNLEKGGIGPGVAESWTMADDGLSWTFKLRPGQMFHNGDRLTAADVKFSLERQMSEKSLAAAAASLRRTIKSIDVVDDLTVKVNTNGAQLGLPASLSRAVAPKARSCRRLTLRRSAKTSSARSQSAVALGSSFATSPVTASNSRP